MANLTTKAEKGRYVYDELRNKSQATQGPVLQWLRERGIEHRSFYIVNAILVKGSREVAEALASRQDVARIEGNPHIQNSLPEPAAFVERLVAASINRRRLNRTSPTRTRRMSGRWGSEARELQLAAQILVNVGTHNALKPQYGAGMESRPITTITGMTQSTTALEIRAAMIRRSLATTTVITRINRHRNWR